VLQADELARLDGNAEGAVAKVVDALKGTVGADEAEGPKTVNDSMFFFGNGRVVEVEACRPRGFGRVCG
jgi:hypothetical protein